MNENGRPDGKECRKGVGPFLEALKEIDSRLGVGVVQADLNSLLGDARVAYDKIGINRLPPDCLLKVAIPLEDAFNAYVRSNNTWNSCLTNFGCDIDSIDPELQKEWATATTKIRKADSGMRKLNR